VTDYKITTRFARCSPLLQSSCGGASAISPQGRNLVGCKLTSATCYKLLASSSRASTQTQMWTTHRVSSPCPTVLSTGSPIVKLLDFGGYRKA